MSILCANYKNQKYLLRKIKNGRGRKTGALVSRVATRVRIPTLMIYKNMIKVQALTLTDLKVSISNYQVYMHGNEAPRCLHQWSPHDGKALSSLFFLDNHLNYNPEEQFWKFAVTGTKFVF